MHERLDELYAIGGGVGANRVAVPRGRIARTSWLRRAGWEAGLEVEVDSAGNLIGRSGRHERLDRLAPRLRPVRRQVRRCARRRRGDRGGRARRHAASSWSSATRSAAASAARPSPTASDSARMLPGGAHRAGAGAGARRRPARAVDGRSSGIVRGERTFEGRAGHAGHASRWRDARTRSSPPPSTSSRARRRDRRSTARSQPSARSTSSPER